MRRERELDPEEEEDEVEEVVDAVRVRVEESMGSIEEEDEVVEAVPVREEEWVTGSVAVFLSFSIVGMLDNEYHWSWCLVREACVVCFGERRERFIRSGHRAHFI